MRSTEKVLELIDEASRMSDRQLEEAIPVPAPPYLIRGALATFAGQLPSDPDELDSFLEGISAFALGLRSDHATA